MASVAKKLFTDRYWMRVEERAFYSDDWIEQVGIMGVNTMEEAEIVLSRFRQVKITIPMLAEYYSKSYRLEFVDQSDVPIMFNIIDTHLDNWTQITNRLGYVSSIPPIEDFELLDNLAAILFSYRAASSELSNVFSLFQGPIGVSNTLGYNGGGYKPYSPALFKYCQQVWG